MSSYERLATDVDATEEAELRRLEGGAAARTCRRQHDTGADHEIGACTRLAQLVVLLQLTAVLTALRFPMLPANGTHPLVITIAPAATATAANR